MVSLCRYMSSIGRLRMCETAIPFGQSGMINITIRSDVGIRKKIERTRGSIHGSPDARFFFYTLKNWRVRHYGKAAFGIAPKAWQKLYPPFR